MRESSRQEDGKTRGLNVSLAGRLSIQADGVSIDEDSFPGRQGRLVFAYLAAESGRPVPRDELAEALWGDAPPATWEKALTVIVSKLRGVLAEAGLDGAAVLTSAFGCYRLELPDDTVVDMRTAARCVAAAESALATGDVGEARQQAERAVSLARMPFLPGESGQWVEQKRREQNAVLVRALGCHAEASLRVGDAAAAARDAEEEVALEPYREDGYRRLMQAYAASGNQAEALRVYEQCRRFLADELGAYPSPETESVYRALLQAPIAPTNDATTEETPPAAQPLASAERKPLLRLRPFALLVAAAAFGAGAIALVATHDSSPAVSPNSLVRIDPDTNEITGAYRVGADPIYVAAVGNWVFATNLSDRTLSRLDTRTGSVRTVGGVGSPYGLAAGPDGTLWVGSDAVSEVTQILPTTLGVLRRIRLPGLSKMFVAVGGGSLWASGDLLGFTEQPSNVVRVLLSSGAVTKRFPVRSFGVAAEVAFGEHAAWVAVGFKNLLVRIDATTGALSSIPIVPWPTNPAVGFESVWVASSDADRLYRVDPLTTEIRDVIHVGDKPAWVATGAGAVWVSNEDSGTVSRVDPRTNEVVATIHTGHHPHGVAVVGGAVWVAVSSKVFSISGTGLVSDESGTP